jgi:hypothetical protein
MATESQIASNRLNAQHSTGPQTAEGKSRTAQNATKLGLFSTQGTVRPEEQAEFDHLHATLFARLKPFDALEEAFSTEILRATWRLRRCAQAEAQTGGVTDSAQASIDRARSQAFGILNRAVSQLRRLQAERAPESDNDTESQNEPEPRRGSRPAAPQSAAQSTPRNALCPCNSGQKYKRCCGINAPAVLHQPA